MLAEWLEGGTPDSSDRLYAETEGNPLFVVEALRAGWKGAQRGWISPKVQAVISSRLVQLSGPARDLACIAAVIGREFTTDVLAHASQLDEETLVRGLDELWRRRIVREQGADAYDFAHDKIREVAYLTLGSARRRYLHLRIAHALQSVYARDPASVSGRLALHYEGAGALDEAVAWYGRAAEAAQLLHANAEAIRLLERALELLALLSPTPERQKLELTMLTTLPAPLGAVVGYASERLDEVQERALTLALSLGAEPPPLLRSLAIVGLSCGDFEGARRFGEQMRDLSQRDADDVLLVEGEYVLGIAAFWQGHFDAARRHFEGAVNHYHPEHRGAHLLRYGLDPKVICLSRLGNTLWFLGRPDEAALARDAALELAGQIGHPHSRDTALVFAALLSLELRDTEGLREYTARLAEGSAEHETRQTRNSADIFSGYVAVLEGRKAVGISRIRGAFDELGARDHAPGMRAFVTRLLLGDYAAASEARAGLEAAERTIEAGGPVRMWEAETRRLRAEFLASLGAPAREIEAEFERALAVARRQGAKMLELKAAMSLLRFRSQRGDEPGTREARNVVAEIFDGFSEGRESRVFGRPP